MVSFCSCSLVYLVAHADVDDATGERGSIGQVDLGFALGKALDAVQLDIREASSSRLTCGLLIQHDGQAHVLLLVLERGDGEGALGGQRACPWE